ncbi:hypothetical protein NMY22_g1144 [Coprinellus aureogranulatus]|nr:hypothetical protein NMY22_g1144 [Coprinellus aureogranulatus]
MHFHFPHPHIDFTHIVEQVRDAMKHYKNEKDSEAHQIFRKAAGHTAHTVTPQTVNPDEETVPGIQHPGSTGVIYCSDRAMANGFSYSSSKEWANLGQGAPEVGPLPGAPPRPDVIKMPLDTLEYAPTTGVKELREAVANLYNHTYRQGKGSQYTYENVCIVPGGRSGLSRIASVIGDVYTSYQIPDYTAYDQVLSAFRRLVPVPTALDHKKKYGYDIEQAKKDIQNQGISVILASNPRNPTGQVIKGKQLKELVQLGREGTTIILDEFYSWYIYPENDNDYGRSVSSEIIEDVNEVWLYCNSINVPAPAPAEDLDEEAACVKVVPDITLKVWTGLLERRGYEVANGEVIRSPSKSQNRRRSATPPLVRRRAKHSGVISAVRSDNTFQAVDKDAGTSKPMPFKRTATASSTSSRQSRAPSSEQEAGPSKSASPPLPKIFAGMRISLLGDAYAPAVVAAIQQSGGEVVTGEDADVYIVRLSSGTQLYLSEEDEDVRGKYRTECWLEQCIHEERVVPVDDHVSFRPLAIRTPVPGANAIHIGLSGLEQSESCFTRRLLKAFGVNLIPMFSKKATHLLCPSGMGLKFDKAQEWGIPVVTNEWLAAIAETGAIPLGDAYTIGATSKGPDVKGKGRAVDIGQVGKLDSPKGKEKTREGSLDDQMDVDNRMNDITNNVEPEPQAPASKPLGKPGGSLERQATTIIPPQQESGGGFGFGQPTEILGSNTYSNGGSSMYPAHPSSVRPLSQGSPVIKYGIISKSQLSMASEQNEDLELPRRSLRGSKSRKLTQQSTPSRKGTQTATSSQAPSEHNDDNNLADYREQRIPSSESPSPMKPPPLQRNSSISPAKLDPGAAKALHESIASLLGKRHSPEDDELPNVETVEENSPATKKGAGTSGAKRAKRPLRAKTTTRSRAKGRKSPSPQRANARVDGAVSLSAFDPYGAAKADEESQRLDDVSARVVFEDPAQKEERRRLMSLLKTNSRGSMSDAAESIDTAFSVNDMPAKSEQDPAWPPLTMEQASSAARLSVSFPSAVFSHTALSRLGVVLAEVQAHLTGTSPALTLVFQG